MHNLFNNYQKQLPYILLGVVLIWFALCLIASADTLGQRNNNPLNLKCSKTINCNNEVCFGKVDNWQGLSGKDKYGHCVFVSLEMGIRAGIINLKTHTKSNPNEPLIAYLRSFAEQNSKQEAEFVAKRLKISIYTKLKNIPLIGLFQALAKFESNMSISEQEAKRIKEKYKI